MKNLTNAEIKRICENSIERVINSSMRCARYVRDLESTPESLKEIADINVQDWEELKALAVKLWNMKRDEIFQEYNK